METFQPYEGEKAYIFISYARKDKNRTFPFLKALHQAGYRIWYDAGIQAGEAWQKVIGSHIQNCGVCLAFISAHSVASRHCKREIQFADKYKKYLIPFYLEESVSLSPGMELIISGIQSLKLSECPTPEEFIERLKRSESFRCCKGEAERREREAGAQSANAQSEVSALPEFLPVFAVNGDIPRPSETAADSGTNETAVAVNGDTPRPSETGTKRARKPSPRIRAIYVNGVLLQYANDERAFLSAAKALRLTFEAVLNDYLGANPAPDKIRTVGAFVGINQTFLRFEAVSGAQFVAKAPLYLNGFSSPVYLATTNDTPTKRKRVTRLCRYLHDKEGQKSRVEWKTTDDNIWLWRPDTRYEMEVFPDSGS